MLEFINNDRKIISIRLKIFREELGLTQSQIASECGTTIKTISNYETGHSEPKTQYLLYLAGKGLNLHWYFTGKGEMLVDKVGESQVLESTNYNDDKTFEVAEKYVTNRGKMPLTIKQEKVLLELLLKNAQYKSDNK
ncbi:XRE family transcriptional regulator [bacterium]|nr:MAG: XRE family transcriptional regulator [bacterium]